MPTMAGGRTEMFRALLTVVETDTDGDPGGATVRIGSAAARRPGHDAVWYRAWSAAVEARLFAGADYRDLDPWLKQLDGAGDLEDCPLSLRRTVRAALFQGLYLRRPDDPRLPELARALVDDLHACAGPARSGAGLPGAVVANRLMVYFAWSGELAPAAGLDAWVRHALAASGAHGAEPACLWASAALYAWASGDPVRAAEAVAAGLAEADRTPEWSFQLHAHGVYAALAHRDEGAAHTHLEALRTLAAEGGALEACHYRLVASLVALADGDHAEAAEQGGIAMVLARQLGAPLVDAFARLGLCRIAVERGEPVVGELLGELADLATRAGNRLLEHLTLLLDAQHNLEAGRRRRAHAQVRRALQLVRRYGGTGLPWWSERSLTFACETALHAGIERRYVRQLIARHGLTPYSADLDDWPYPLRIYTLGRFSVVRDEVPVRFDRKPQRRPLDLLKVVVALGGRDVPVDKICAILWPDAEGDAAHHAFESALYRLRRLIGVDQALVVESGHLSLDNRYCWVDAWAFERILSKVERLVHAHDTSRRRERLGHLVDRALALYHGDFLGQEENEPWTVRLRERLRSKFVRRLVEVGVRWERMHAWDQAIACYEKGLDVDDLVEAFYQRLITCHAALGRQAEALACYRRCRRTLSLVLGVKPSRETEEAVRRLLEVRIDP